MFLTGERRCGKSTALLRAAELLGLPCYGFRTFFTDRSDADRALYIAPAWERQPAARPDRIVVQFAQGKPHPMPERFDALGGALLADAREHPGGLIVMDECGRFERDAAGFQREIVACLDGDIPIMGVLQTGVNGWSDAIRRHPGVKLLSVTDLNRELIPRMALEALKGEMTYV